MTALYAEYKGGKDETTASGEAVISDDGKYRYRLSRVWDPEKPTCVWMMLNPSTADATENDPTIWRCVVCAKKWGAGRIDVYNMFGWRATQPHELMIVDDPVGPRNDYFLGKITQKKIILGWGNMGAKFPARLREIRTLFREKELFCLGISKFNQPFHPLYLPSATPLEPYFWEGLDQL